MKETCKYNLNWNEKQGNKNREHCGRQVVVVHERLSYLCKLSGIESELDYAITCSPSRVLVMTLKAIALIRNTSNQYLNSIRESSLTCSSNSMIQ